MTDETTTTTTTAAAPTRARSKVTTAQVVAFVGTDKKTVGDVAAQFGVTAATARKHLAEAFKKGELVLLGETRKAPNGGRGRPSELYAAPGTEGIPGEAAPQ